MTGKTSIQWAPRIKPALIRSLYETDAQGIVDDVLINEVGYQLLARCESICRVTERRCPECGEPLEGAWDHDQPDRQLTCSACQWTSTWKQYHSSYKRRRVHGGRAYSSFVRFLEEYPHCTTPQAKMLAIDKLIHAVHEMANRIWTLPAAVNLIQARYDEVVIFLDEMAYGDHVPDERKVLRDEYLRKIEESREPTQLHAEEVKRRHQK